MSRGFSSILYITLAVSTTSIFGQSWNAIDFRNIDVTGQRDIIPTQFVTYHADDAAIRSILFNAPDENSTRLSNSTTLLTVGLADGTTDVFKIVEYDMMEPGLFARYPEIRTYRGVSVSNPYRRMRADWTESGFRAVIKELSGTTFIDEFQRNDLAHRIVYYRKDFERNGDWSCGFEESRDINSSGTANRVVGDCVFRNYRLAVATSGEYSNFFGAFSSAQSHLILSQVVTAINRINDVYEVDIAVRLTLVENTDTVFYYVPGSDPYSGDACTHLGQNQTAVNNRIGSANYDIGHVFSVGSGGCASLGVICSNSFKARGATGLNPPTGDPFYIDYVAHELGHQFGGNHTQNNSCNRNSNTSMEPGSASTIMGYAGICSPNVQNNSDAYFHAINLEEIANEISSTNCASTISSANSAPVLSNVPNYIIPELTPFVLTASATDEDNNALTYCWEQMDQEVRPMPPKDTSKVGPMFRSLLPTSSPSRYFYNLPDLLNNNNPTWEELPSVGRVMDFKVTVRDLYDGTFGCTDEDNMTVTTVNNIGPFLVTSQGSATNWIENSAQTITWNVANTTASPVSCANVDIFLSYDGGYTYPVALLNNDPNDGSATITVPDGLTTQGRVMVRGDNNIFFDINNANITIQPCVMVVTLTSGTGSGSLPAAISCADAGDIILLSAGLNGQTINVGSTPLIINKNLTIQSLASDVKITGSGLRVFEVANGTTFELSSMTLIAGTSLTGGALINQGNLTLTNVKINKNVAVSGATLIQNTGGQLRLVGNCSMLQ